MRFTDQAINALKVTGKCYEVSETNGRGLRIRVSPTGTRTFEYVFRRQGKSYRLALGAAGDITLNDARTTHAALRNRVRAGESLYALRAFTRAGRTSASLSVADLANEWLQRRVRPRRKTWRDVERMLKKDVIPYLGERPAAAVKAREIVEMLDCIVDRGSPVAANRCASIVKQMFRFGVGRGILDASPCLALERPGGTESSRDRILSDAEINGFWHKLDTAGMSPGARIAIRLLLVTAQRRGELAQAKKDEFDRNTNVWHIPAGHSKNGKAHDVPLSLLALMLLDQLFQLAGHSDYLLPSPTVKDAPIRAEALTRCMTRNRVHFGLEAFNVHDLRRTAASGMTALGVPRLHVSKVLNHTGRDITAIYDRHDYFDEKRNALDRWAAKVDAVVE